MDTQQLTQAEFKGKVLQSLEDIRKDIGELGKSISYCSKEITIIKVDLANKACKEDIRTIQNQINGVKLVSSTLGAIGGFVTAITTLLVRK